MFYNTVVAQAQKIEVAADRVTFTFSPTQRTLARHLRAEPAVARSDRAAGWPAASLVVTAAQAQNRPRRPAATPAEAAATEAADKKSALREQALADAGVQALLEVFPAEIRDVEEM